jgi:hypothetical protein
MGNIISIYGPVGSRKSTLALTYPGKKFVCDLEYGTHRALWLFPPDSYTHWMPQNSRFMAGIDFSKGDLMIGYQDRWKEVIDQFRLVYPDKSYSAVVFDTAKELWTLDHSMSLEEKQQNQINIARAEATKKNTVFNEATLQLRQSLIQIEYGPANSRIDNLFNACRASHLAVILINHERDARVPQYNQRSGEMEMVPSGKKELDGWSKTDKISDWIIKTSQPQLVNGQLVTVAEVIKSPIGSEFLGPMQAITDDSGKLVVSLANLAKMVEMLGRRFS